MLYWEKPGRTNRTLFSVQHESVSSCLEDGKRWLLGGHQLFTQPISQTITTRAPKTSAVLNFCENLHSRATHNIWKQGWEKDGGAWGPYRASVPSVNNGLVSLRKNPPIWCKLENEHLSHKYKSRETTNPNWSELKVHLQAFYGGFILEWPHFHS